MNLKLTPEQFESLREYSRYKGSLVFEDEKEQAFDPFDHSGLYEPDGVEETDRMLLKLNVKGNAKIKHPYISLPAGWSCPGAKVCKSKADPQTGKIKDGPSTKFRCYAASDEGRYPKVRDQRWTNFELLRECKSVTEMADLIILSIKTQIPLLPKVFRLHESGDFFNQMYFDAWISVAAQLPETIFYTYTKAINFWVQRKGQIPPNLKLNASLGGAYDELIHQHNLKYVDVVFSVEDAVAKKLPIDKDDSLAWKQDRSFAVLLHGIQPKGSEAGEAMKKLRDQGFTGYSKNKVNEELDPNHVKRFKTYFKGKKFTIDGFTYEFVSIRKLPSNIHYTNFYNAVVKVGCEHGAGCSNLDATQTVQRQIIGSIKK